MERVGRLSGSTHGYSEEMTPSVLLKPPLRSTADIEENLTVNPPGCDSSLRTHT